MSDEAEGPVGPVEYAEAPRSYRETAVVLLVVAVGVALDGAFGHAVEHLPGWLLAAAVLGGADALFVHAARATRSLVVTPDALWVGDATVARDAIAGLSPDPEADAPVLGWPNGRPGRWRGIAVRLTDGRDLLVPTRRGDAVTAALGLGAAPEREGTTVRVAAPADLALLPDIDERADTVFRVAGYDLPDLPTGLPDDDRLVLVAGDPPVGFARVTEVDREAHLAAIAVLPAVMHTGTGRRLLDAACAWAAEAGYVSMTLTTYADVPWNAPWYARRGFTEVADPSPGLAAIRAHEREVGLDAVGRRVVMRRALP